jgi:hypothetical protein
MKMWYLYTMEFYAAMKKNEVLSFTGINGWNWRTSFCVRLAWPKRPKIICSPSYVDIRSRANTTRGLNFDHKIKVKHTREI